MGDNDIKARISVRKATVTCYVTFKEVSLILRWPRQPDPELAWQHVNILLKQLPDLAREGLQEVIVQSESQQLDDELRQMFGDDE